MNQAFNNIYPANLRVPSIDDITGAATDFIGSISSIGSLIANSTIGSLIANAVFYRAAPGLYWGSSVIGVAFPHALREITSKVVDVWRHNQITSFTFVFFAYKFFSMPYVLLTASVILGLNAGCNLSIHSQAKKLLRCMKKH